MICAQHFENKCKHQYLHNFYTYLKIVYINVIYLKH